MKFGKIIQVQQVPGWSGYYLDYKLLKKIISSLAANRPAPEAATLASGVRPSDIFNPASTSRSPPISVQGPSSVLGASPGQPPIFSSSDQDEDRGPGFQAHKAAFFFKLERELEKINAFYLQKEAELKLRLETLLSKRRAAAARGLPDPADDGTQLNVEWSAVEEGFRLLERDLGKLQQYIEINAIGFRKILKKFDKRSKSTTRELYLARQVDVQPVFNRQLISELADTVAACLVDITDLTAGLNFEGPAAQDIFTQQINTEHAPQLGPFRDLETNLRKAVATADRSSIADCARYSDALVQQSGGKANVTRILWNVIIEAPPDLADLILASLTVPFDFQFIDDINGRTCLHEACIAGASRLVDICIDKGVLVNKKDVYGRSALQYAAMNGYANIVKRLLHADADPNALDLDNYSALVYATLRGSIDCVRTLLEEGHVPVQPPPMAGDLIPLTLASQSGHYDVVVLLLQYGAQCLPNSNGEYPMHLAAREGHLDVCQVLLHQDGWDTPDKFHEWTPIFHAARYGHNDCIHLLLKAGCRTDVTDELGNTAVHYAAWYGHHDCVHTLLNATPTLTAKNPIAPPAPGTPSEMEVEPMSEIDFIPSLSLPPPIMPHRVYGHNYLDKVYLVQVTLGHTAKNSKGFSGVKLHHRLISPALKDEYLLASAPMKLVMTTDSDVGAAPYSVPLPQREQNGAFAFQIPSLDKLSLKFSVYPNFGTKTIGRAVALPSLFADTRNNQRFTLPILDNRLHVIGEVPFEVNIISPFENVTLEVGGDVETYWKSTSLIIPDSVSAPVSAWPRQSTLGSVQTSPSAYSIVSTSSQAHTVTSLRGDYIYIVVQVTKDFQPVVYSDWRLPEARYDLSVADVTLAQFEALAVECGRNFDPSERLLMQDWLDSDYMISLSQLLKSTAPTIGMSLELAYPSNKTLASFGASHALNLNKFVDSILRTIYQASTWTAGSARRKIAFSSFSPDVCSALNWKQPNYPVFFSSMCGKKLESSPSLTALSPDDDEDRRLLSLAAGVEFARANNFLGIWVDAELLSQVPSLIHEIKEAGLLVGVYGATAGAENPLEINGNSIDACIREGSVTYTGLSGPGSES
ncbi:hypothetical protein HGRIS_009212 [Hohenbuehelia grisea]|uniref:Cyclin-dependent protein kinase inhibitor n=1 Tax=Hohenbuehelia grisea TaxID=104357 RepID=A0ABR3J0K6_9AGAR